MMVHYQKIFFLLFICLYSYQKIEAQDNQDLRFQHLTIDDGLSSNRINQVLQDAQGFIWVGTNNGLNRYDGYEFKTYLHDPNNKYSIPGNEISLLYEDKGGILWFSTNGRGFFQYDELKDQFQHYLYFNDRSVIAFTEDNENNLWIWGKKFILKKQNKYFQDLSDKIIDKDVRTICKGLQEDKVWLGTNKGLYLFDTKKYTLTPFQFGKTKSDTLISSDIRKIYLDKSGKLWIGYLGKGKMSILDTKTLTITHLLHQENNFNGITNHEVSSFKEIDDQIWIGKENGGVSIFDINSQKFQHHTYQKDKKQGLSNNSIAGEGFYKDRQGRIWVSTHFGGLNILDKYATKFTPITESLPNPTVNAILKDSKQNLWIGTEAGILKIEKNGQKKIFLTCPILHINEDNKGQIWLGTWNQGVQLYQEDRDQFIQILPGEKDRNNIFSVIPDTDHLWIVAKSGLIKMEYKHTEKFKYYENGCANQTSALTQGFKFKDEIWICSDKGVKIFDIKTELTTCITHDPNHLQSLSSNLIMNIFCDKKARYWVGTMEGLNLKNGKNNFKRITKQDGLPNDVINSLLEDRNGNLWIATNKGMSKYNPEKNTFRNFDVLDGLQSNEFRWGSCFQDKDGFMYFGGVNGLNIFHPDSIRENPHKPPMYITKLKLFNQVVQIGEYDSLLKQDISLTKEITFNYTQSVFSFEFVGLNFTNPEKNQYAYKLEGFDKDWVYVGNKREATYTNLDEGTYTFRVKASNNDGLWNEEGTSIKIIILPPWWETWWFRGFVTILILSSGISFYLIRISAVKRQNQKLEKTVTKRTQELQSANYDIKVRNEELTAISEELRQNMEELETSQELLREQKQTIENAFQLLNLQNTKVNDSIRYAQRIQNAILPHQDTLANSFAEHFVIFKPKDVVSGDFYWFLEIENKRFLAVVDCTGHGVPGAFMSMIGNTLLYEIINAKRIFEPHLILEELHQGVLNSLNKNNAKIQDGMDIALCCIEKQDNNTTKVLFSGAKRPLYYFSDNKLTEIQAGRKSIGQKDSTVDYKSHEIILQEGNTLYMTTDGWIDSINPQRMRFGSHQFREMLLKGANLPLKAQQEIFNQILDDYEQGTEQRDDILFVGVKV